MRVYLKEEGSSKFVQIAGPGDLVGKTGALRVSGPPTERSAGLWTVPIGNFVVSGGVVERKSAAG